MRDKLKIVNVIGKKELIRRSTTALLEAMKFADENIVENYFAYRASINEAFAIIEILKVIEVSDENGVNDEMLECMIRENDKVIFSLLNECNIELSKGEENNVGSV